MRTLGPSKRSLVSALDQVSQTLVGHSTDLASVAQLLGGGHVGEQGGDAENAAKPAAARPDAESAGEATGRFGSIPVSRHQQIWGALDPTIATVARWADENPAVMRRLLTDPALQRQLLGALDNVVGGREEVKKLG